MSDSLFDQPAMARPYAASANAVDHSLEQFSNTDCDCRDRRTSSTSICSAYSTAPSDFYEARCIVSSAGSLDHLCNSLDGIDMRSFNPKLLRKNGWGESSTSQAAAESSSPPLFSFAVLACQSWEKMQGDSLLTCAASSSLNLLKHDDNAMSSARTLDRPFSAIHLSADHSVVAPPRRLVLSTSRWPTIVEASCAVSELAFSGHVRV
eukprot:CAMPEP_0117672164 /NCGR_PEP_ID=MMETSP0804-20121206/13749_1 /TAXON_ID=1074897 /ORGANISM="Tetraselmis astigmatica, Strain CCMP880" /LENGTH=206 /DNA_ID=CAMNT_0005480729 /DNA_START=109 /DNA_END=730 /DNA_ORIENTATION=-